MAFRVRALDANYDMTFGRGARSFLVDTPAAVAQCVLTRLQLWQTEWYLDVSDGTPWLQSILGKPLEQPSNPDVVIRERILGTPFVERIIDYGSSYDSSARIWTVGARIDTSFGRTSFVFSLAMPPPAPPAIPAR